MPKHGIESGSVGCTFSFDKTVEQIIYNISKQSISDRVPKRESVNQLVIRNNFIYIVDFDFS